MDEQDKRRSHRVKVELPVSFKASIHQRHVSIGTTMDISATGICLKTREKLDEGQLLEIQLKLPTDETLVIRTKVVWVREMDYGLSPDFLAGIKIVDQMNDDEAKFIRYYVRLFFDHFRKSDNLPPGFEGA